MKLEDIYLRDLLARLDGDGASVMTASQPNRDASVADDADVGLATAVAEEEHYGDAEAALEERLTALRRQLSAITRSDRSADTQPKSASPASTLPELTALTPPPCEPTATIAFVPTAPKTIEELGLEQQQIEAIVLKYLLNRGVCAGRQIAEQLGLLFSLMERVLFSLKAEQLVVQKGAAPLSDYVYQLTPQGLEDARRYYKSCSYIGTLPVPLEDYIASVKAQSIRRLQPTTDDLACVFQDLMVDERLRSQIGEAVYAGKGFFLYGAPGNGKTSIAERVARAFGQYIWIPRTIGIAGEIVRLFDPCNHEEVATDELGAAGAVDRRWIRIRRPTVIAGGELTMDRLEITVSKTTGVNEAPLQLKSNCGVLVIDDFGRQRMSVSELLNRWIVPLDRAFDFLNLPSGKTIQVPFDQLLVFSTNLEPRELVDEAFLRRISYKIEVSDPSLDDFRKLMAAYAERINLSYDESVVEYLIQEHYLLPERAIRACHARDLLDQVRSFCGYRGQPAMMSREAFDAAVKNYFGLTLGGK